MNTYATKYSYDPKARRQIPRSLMDNIFYMPEIGALVKEVTVDRYTNGVNEPYTVYEIISD